ncbi:MAG: SRPBCC domain-containing protein [endosymbiont of Galathealinum brachiosum]|uniref:SRPBCC domain-containing protein n=1 Tax=endosymbiont of Galathealinum brachiosum TaxID=2200906 RepID=A0A370D7V9_9GAMM|nr:MAG: SRPBCC domain-containing protein [endosymbiont of Galathealinum brachiosum]
MIMTDLAVNVNKTIDAPVKDVFEAWLNPKTLTKFILPMPGMPEPDVESDSVEGGKFTIIMHVGEDKIPHTGQYLEIERFNKLVFTWESPFSTDNSTVSLLFKAITDTQTHVELTHVRFIDEEARSNHEGGWTNILDRLNEIIS